MKTINYKKNQQGSVLILVAIAMVSILGIAGLAIDGGHAFVNKTRLHNSLDSAALAAAKVLDVTGNQGLAIQAGQKIFQDNLANSANDELTDIGASTANMNFEFSDTLSPFVPSSEATNYVRVRMSNDLTMDTFFMTALGQNDLDINTSSIAGPSPTLGVACDIAPIMVCGNPNASDSTFWGYNVGDDVTLKLSTDSNNEVGPGNFQLIRLGDSTGGADIRDNLAGMFDQCAAVTDTMPTEPGNTVGPVAQGLNTRFGIYNGPVSADEFPPDLVVTPGNYDQYQDAYNGGNWDREDGVEGRRIIAVPFGDCTGTINGAGNVDILGLGCVFLTNPATQAGNTQEIHGQIIAECNTGGVPGPEPVIGVGPHTIQLYGDTAEWDS